MPTLQCDINSMARSLDLMHYVNSGILNAAMFHGVIWTIFVIILMAMHDILAFYDVPRV